MKAILHPYQIVAKTWLTERTQATLLLDMGLGKSLITLSALVEMMLLGEPLGRILIIAPLLPARHTWPTEIAKWDHTAHLTYSLVLGSAAERRAALRHRADIYIVNRENVVWLVEHYGRSWPFQTVVIDELSSFKSRSAKRFRALRKVRPLIKRVYGLTGTPAPNGLMDLWAQINLLDLGERLGKYIGGYRERYFTPGQRNGYTVFSWTLKPGSEGAIYERIEDIALSMRAKDKLNLPGRISNTVEIILDEPTMQAYRHFERDQVMTLLGTEVTAANAAAVTNKLLQFANGAVYDDEGKAQEIHYAKLDALEGIIEEAQGQPILIFYNFRHDLARLKARFPKAEVLDARSIDTIDRWNEGAIPLLLAHPQGTGHGLNLQTGGHIIVWFGLTWSLEAYQQANARLDRQGQTQTVIVHHLVVRNTYDERVMEVLEGKANLQDAMMNTLQRANEDPSISGFGVKNTRKQNEGAE